MKAEQIDIDKVLVELKAVTSKAMNEEELKINAERILYDEVISKLGLQPGRQEYTFISGGRADALYGHVIIEYKAPGKLSKSPDIAKAKEQLISYIKKEAEVVERYILFLGVILCDKIAFIKYDVKVKDWQMRGPYDLNREVVLRLIEAIRGLRRKRLAVDELLRDFGPQSEIAMRAVNILYNKINKSKSSKANALFNDWKRLFSQVCAYSPEKLKGLEVEYNIKGHVDYNALLFSIHTYYALIMKLLGAEVAYLYGAGKWLKSYVAELEDAYIKGLNTLKTALEDLESGGIFKSFLNITNFMEGDYFSWYLEELDEQLATVISEISKRISDYEPSTPVLEPEYTRDLLKRLYQNLVPQKIRHDLGEYYTPDWLAELVLNEVEFTVKNFEKLSQEKNDTLAPLNLRVLDPACGSGTFLVLMMKRLREYAENHYLRDILANYLLKNVVGFDLNPLAILAARTNYLLAVADLIPYLKGSIEIPIYLADSLLVEEKSALMTGKIYEIRTYVGDFQIPKSIVENGLLGRLLEAVDRYVRIKYKQEDFEDMIRTEIGLDEHEIRLAGKLYRAFLTLENQGKNHVWTSIIKNAFAPLTITRSVGKFDYVVGNPPWVNWESLPSRYRETTKPIWSDYGLFSLSGKQARLGGGKKDISMLFVYTSVDKYLKDNALLAFLMTQTLFKTSGAGKGFRRFAFGNKQFQVMRVHDLVDLAPFEGAQNRTSIVLIKTGLITNYPVTYILWKSIIQHDFSQVSELTDILNTTKRIECLALPVDPKDTMSPWSTLPVDFVDILQKLKGESVYKAWEGANTGGANGVFWMEVIHRLPNDDIFVRNFSNIGKKKVKSVTMKIEPELIYLLLRGRDVKQWRANPSSLILLTQDPKKRIGIDEKTMKVSYPKTYSYLNEFKDFLKARPLFIKYFGGRAAPFYTIYNVGEYTLSSYKVVWRYIATELLASVVDPAQDGPFKGKSVIPDCKLMFVPCETKDEAHYICALLNSSPIKLLAKSYIVETQISTHILKNIAIMKFAPNNEIHRRLSELSKRAHSLPDGGESDELIKIENDIDVNVAKIYGLSNDELIKIIKASAILRGEEIEKEEAKEEPSELKVDFLNAVVKPNAIGRFEVAISNPLKETTNIEIQLPDRLVKLETNKEVDKTTVKVSHLEVGEYKIPYRIITPKGVTEGEFILYVKEEKRRKAREAFTSKLDELMGD